LEALPIGTQRLRKRIINKRYVREERLVKVSHHGTWWQRWRPFARYWWEQNVGPIPAGYRVFHRDGDTLNDDPQNFVLCRAERFQLIFASNPEASEAQKRRRSNALAKSNRRRARVAQSQIKPSAWYLVLPLSHAIIWQPCRTKRAARRLSVAENLLQLCHKDRVRIEEIRAALYEPGHQTQVVQGADLIRWTGVDGAFEGFIRLVPDVRRAPKKRRPKPTDNLAELLRAG
jgi:hypothetical protein